MQPETNEANTKTWLEASKEVKIRAYIESYTSTLSIREKPFASRGLYDSLVAISVPHQMKHAATLDSLESLLGIELQAWDVLSDEALRDFEQGLK